MVATARRLLRLGASPATPVGYGDQGATAFDYAKQTGDPELLKALQPTPRTL